MKMHDDELHIDEDMVRPLIIGQFPHWRTERVQHIVTGGTINAVFRIDSRLTARFPLRTTDLGVTCVQLTHDAAAMRRVAVPKMLRDEP